MVQQNKNQACEDHTADLQSAEEPGHSAVVSGGPWPSVKVENNPYIRFAIDIE